MAYVEICIGNKKFVTGQLVIVGVKDTYTFIDTYKDEAFAIACDKLGLNLDDCCILDWRFLGENVIFIN